MTKKPQNGAQQHKVSSQKKLSLIVDCACYSSAVVVVVFVVVVESFSSGS